METKIFDYGMNGEGVAKIDGKIVLIENSLIDEVVDLEIVEDNKNYALSKVNQIIIESENRQIPPCPYFFECGGCDIQHMKYDEQLKFKTNHIKKTIKKICKIDVDVNQTVACSIEFNYRNKMSFSVNKKHCGLLKKNSKEIVNISSCPLADNNINKVLSIFNNYISIYNGDLIKNLVVRSINNQILVGVVAKENINLKPFFEMLKKDFEHIGLYVIINKRNDSVVLSGQVHHIGGIKEIQINEFDLTYSVDLLGFHQTNLEIQNKLYNHVLKCIDENSVVVNGFSGQGLMSAIIAKKAKKVTGIEINKSSHLSAEQLKQNNNIKNLTNICGDFHKHIKPSLKTSNTIILDPTKKGCGKQVMNEIKGVENIIYISCNPIALCKDLNEILDTYSIEEITPFDMFPNTVNVETFVKLKRRK
ncbi:MAG: 23S rRNA (uracil(1939)-C(5))-methyltransferase RlmD [Clostridia bacterium]|nr:23S rRNA (uracil(1939)-C(5))-methyltransferase RlmD [Clostridia bacterium]